MHWLLFIEHFEEVDPAIRGITLHFAPDEPVFDLFFFHFGHVTGQSGRLLERSGP